MGRKYISCKVCGDLHWSDNGCPPVFTIEYEEGDKKVYAYDFDAAAEKFAEWYIIHSDYWLMDNEMEIKVIDSNGVEKNFIVGAEQSVEYWSKEI